MLQSSSPIVIVGAGYSGALAAVQLLRRPGSRRIVLVERSAVFARGLAYQNHDDNLLLNVPAGNMSALAGEPEHFVDFCRAIDPSFNAGSFVSRRLYGDYLQHLLAESERAAPGRLERRIGEVTGVFTAPHGFDVRLADGRQIAAGQVLLALGHFAPRDPLPAPGLAAFGSRCANAGDLAALDALPRDRPVLLLGSGHTATDVLFRLCCGARPRPVLMLSRRGLLPQGHRQPPRAPAAGQLPGWLAEQPSTLRAWVRGLRREAAQRMAEGGDWRDVLNELRPHTPALWQRLPLAERRRFLRRAVAWWDVHRHRLAPAAERRLQGLLASGQAEHLAARVTAVQPVDEGVELTLRLRGGASERRVVGAVVNCTGPNVDITTIDSPLLRQLQAEGLVRPDPLGLGLEVDEQYRVVGRAGQPVDGLFYLGPMLKARYWEAIAVPELRGHVLALAALLDVGEPMAAPAEAELQAA